MMVAIVKKQQSTPSFVGFSISYCRGERFGFGGFHCGIV